MPSTIRRVARTGADRFEPRSAAVAVAAVVAVAFLPDATLADDLDLLGSFAVVALALEAADAARRTTGVNAALVTAATGAVPTLGGVTLLWTGASPVLGTVGVLVGAWLTLDGLVAYRAGEDRTPSDEDVDLDAEVVAMTHGSLLVDELGAEPRTVPDLAAACDLTETRVEAALERLTDAGLVHETDAGYVLDERELGATGLLRRAVRRVLAPFRTLLG